MREPPDRGPAPIVDDRLAVAVLQRFGAHMRPVFMLLVVAVFAEEPQRRMRPEEREGAAEQEQHELRSDPGTRIFVEIMRGGVRLEAEEALGRVEVALLTRLQTVGRIDSRPRIVDALNRVIAVAVEALGGIGEAERVDLAVVRALVRGQFLLVAAAAVLGDQELRLVEERILNVVRGVAVRADRRLRVALEQNLLSMHRGLVLSELGRVTGAAGVRQIEPPPVIVRRVPWIDVVRIVAVVAGCVGVRLIDLARLRVDRLHVAAYHVDHAGQLGDLIGLVVVLCVLELAFVAGDAAHLHGDRVVRNLGDVGVALDALQLAVHAAEEAVLKHHGELLFAGRRWWRETFEAVAAETHFAGELGCRLVGVLILRARVGNPQAGRRNDTNEAGGDLGRKMRNSPAHANIHGGGILL